MGRGGKERKNRKSKAKKDNRRRRKSSDSSNGDSSDSNAAEMKASAAAFGLTLRCSDTTHRCSSMCRLPRSCLSFSIRTTSQEAEAAASEAEHGQAFGCGPSSLGN